MKRQLPKLRHFTPKEIKRAVSIIDNLTQIEYENLLVLLNKIDATRHELANLYPNIGFYPIDIRKVMRKGSSRHNTLDAIDFYMTGYKIDNVLINKLMQTALDCAFRGFGVYLNEKGYYSFHLDSRNYFKFWTGTKKKHEDAWTYGVFEFFGD